MISKQSMKEKKPKSAYLLYAEYRSDSGIEEENTKEIKLNLFIFYITQFFLWGLT